MADDAKPSAWFVAATPRPDGIDRTRRLRALAVAIAILAPAAALLRLPGALLAPRQLVLAPSHAASPAAVLLGLAALVTDLAATILSLVWIYQLAAHTVARGRPGQASPHPLWAVGAWFIPLAGSDLLGPWALWASGRWQSRAVGLFGTWWALRVAVATTALVAFFWSTLLFVGALVRRGPHIVPLPATLVALQGSSAILFVAEGVAFALLVLRWSPRVGPPTPAGGRGPFF
ncbi:MAG: hypothetical protein ACYDBQ_04600 [Thermoplasmatota archaeon]